ncbi:MAG: DUF1614 domain-containing protein [Acidimicrobiales bacterium]
MTSVDRTWASPGRPEPTRSPRELARRLLGEIDTLDCAIYDTLAHTPTPIVFLAGVMLVVAVLVGLDVITYAHQRIGLSPGWLFAALLGSIIGSWFDIPVARLPDRSERRESDAVAFGVRYRIPTVVHTGTTTVAVNVGGALIPSALAGYLVVHSRIWLHALIAVAVVSVLVWLVARPVPSVGTVAPTFIPPIVASIGGVGPFGGIFLTGILAVLLAGL